MRDVDLLARELRVPTRQIALWRDEFISAGTEALKARFARSPDHARLKQAQAKVGELSMQVEILQELFQKRGAPAAAADVAALLVSPTGELRPLALVCRTIGLADLLLGIRRILAEASFSGEGHRNV